MVALFWSLFLATVAALITAIATGIRGRRRAHFVVVALFVVLLTATILTTEALVRVRHFPERELGIHLPIAITATALLAPVVVTGIGFARYSGRRWRLAHRSAVIVFVLAVLAATGTGIWVFTLAT